MNGIIIIFIIIIIIIIKYLKWKYLLLIYSFVIELV
jgi:hypothetical protein